MLLEFVVVVVVIGAPTRTPGEWESEMSIGTGVEAFGRGLEGTEGLKIGVPMG